MTIFEAIIKGLVQGLTEFLPVSSSAHLVFSDHFLHLRQSQGDVIFFDVMLHLGTLLAVVVYFRRDLLAILRGAGQLIARPRAAWRENMNSRLFVWLLIGTAPAAVLGKLLQDKFEQAFGSVPGTAALLLLTAAMLFWISRKTPGTRTIEHLGTKDALWIGLMQALAILPGVSRSGATITAGLMRGLDREAAPRFSFLLSAPIILGGGLLALKDALELGTGIPTSALAAGFIASAVSGYLAVVLLLGVVRRGKLHRFAIYCTVAGVGMLGYWFLLVPKVAGPVAGFVAQQPIYTGADGQLGPLHPGQSLNVKVIVDPGLLPLREAYVQRPDGHRLPLSPEAVGNGRLSLASDASYDIPLESHAQPAGEIKDLWVILRNKWGIENEVRLRLLVVPASPIETAV